MIRQLMTVAAAGAIVVCLQSSVFAQAQTNGANAPLPQLFRLNVPQNITITCPDVLVEQNHDDTDTDQVFPTQTWEVKGNAQPGVTVTFQLTGPFVLTTGSGLNHQMRDASLDINIASTQGPAIWTGSATNIASNITAGTAPPLYTATSNGVGRAYFDLDMTFVNYLGLNGYGSYEEGVYETTVIGTVTSN